MEKVNIFKVINEFSFYIVAIFKIAIISLFLDSIASEDVGGSMTVNDIASNSNQFGLKLFKQFNVINSNENISPISIYMALSMVLCGAESETAEQITNTLLIKQNCKTYEVSMKEYYNYYYSFEKDKNNKICIGNGLWIALQFPIVEQFQTCIRNYYGEIRNADFKNNNKIEIENINKWIASKTNNMIFNTIREVNPSAKLILVNTIYFNAQWQMPFDIKQTKKMEFYNQSGSFNKVNMMKLTNIILDYYENNQLQLVCIPYKNNVFEMVIILPKQINNSYVDEKLNEENIKDWSSRVYKNRVNLFLPKFKIQNEYNLKEPLKKMGMISPFLNNANFSNINKNGNIFIDAILHETHIEVNEEGTEASAVTVIEMNYTFEKLIDNTKVKEMKVDHTFYFIIRERKTGSIFFIGKINNPI